MEPALEWPLHSVYYQQPRMQLCDDDDDDASAAAGVSVDPTDIYTAGQRPGESL